ncbi:MULTISPECIES: tyrosine-protein phosphatase [Rhodococcus]|uniref:tyrosine-protein phosphatase n=1 Tax=Rhodococcus TaxID=1827 RepID=UPI000832EB72|nr:tyrosine-protein phosphatase [Rhodococcus phenolicus]
MTAEDQRAQFATLLEQIAEADGPVVIHCTSGKDRTGWASALLLHIAGVSDEDIMANYLLTNEYAADYIDATAAAMAETRGTEFGEAIRVVLSVEADYLQAGISTAIEQYGSLDLYLTEGLGLEKETLTDLRNKLTTA